MDDRYETYCLIDPLFYEAVHSGHSAGGSFLAAERSLPDGWQRRELDDWFVFNSGNTGLPTQGWKIHVAGCQGNAERILNVVWDYCVSHGIDFKFLRSPVVLLSRLSKYAPHESSGKLVTIYPVDESACETILGELGNLLEGEAGPYILGDLRWGKGPLYVRYGGFFRQYCQAATGQTVLAITDDTHPPTHRPGPGR